MHCGHCPASATVALTHFFSFFSVSPGSSLGILVLLSLQHIFCSVRGHQPIICGNRSKNFWKKVFWQTSACCKDCSDQEKTRKVSVKERFTNSCLYANIWAWLCRILHEISHSQGRSNFIQVYLDMKPASCPSPPALKLSRLVSTWRYFCYPLASASPFLIKPVPTCDSWHKSWLKRLCTNWELPTLEELIVISL